MATKNLEMRTIPIQFEKGRIDLGERYAFALELDSRLEWRCDRPIAVSFDWDAPFVLSRTGKKRLTLRFKAGAVLRPNHPYPYRIAAVDKGTVVNGMAIIIVKPPPPPPWEKPHWRLGKEPGTLIAGGRRR